MLHFLFFPPSERSTHVPYSCWHEICLQQCVGSVWVDMWQADDRVLLTTRSRVGRGPMPHATHQNHSSHNHTPGLQQSPASPTHATIPMHPASFTGVVV